MPVHVGVLRGNDFMLADMRRAREVGSRAVTRRPGWRSAAHGRLGAVVRRGWRRRAGCERCRCGLCGERRVREDGSTPKFLDRGRNQRRRTTVAARAVEDRRRRRRRRFARADRRVGAGVDGEDAAALQGVDRARRRPGPHDAARGDAAADQRPPGGRAHRSDESLLFERAAGARPPAGRPAAPPACARRAARRPPDERHGGHPGPRRHRRRRGRRSRGAARAGRRPRLRVGHAALRRLLPVPARALGHVPVPRARSVPTISSRLRTCATARRSTRTRTSAGSAELMVTFEEWVVPIFTKLPARRRRHGVQLRRGRGPRRDDRARAGADRARVERRGRRLRAARV